MRRSAVKKVIIIYPEKMEYFPVNLGIIKEHTEVKVNKELGRTDCLD